MKYYYLLVFLLSPAFSWGKSSFTHPQRVASPVVLTGIDFIETSLYQTIPDYIVGFRYTEALGWEQVPIQIDERDSVNALQIYGRIDSTLCHSNWCEKLYLYDALCYSDIGTFTGPDMNIGFDEDDELVFMARDIGEKALAYTPPFHIIQESGVEVVVSDPLTHEVGYLYLFLQDCHLPQSPRSYVQYDFSLESGTYMEDYVIGTGFNPEDSWVRTEYYAQHFSDRWIRDGLYLQPDKHAPNLFDRHKNLFAPGNCLRHEETFSSQEGAFVTNKSGPVRAIRSYFGCNSGPLTQRTHYFYEQAAVHITNLRVHALKFGFMDFYDYSSAAKGIKYYSNWFPKGVEIDGQPDELPELPYPINWEYLEGEQGSLLMFSEMHSDFPMRVYPYYLDDDSPASLACQCTGDNFSYGASGNRVLFRLPTTDPRETYYRKQFEAMKIVYYNVRLGAVLDVVDYQEGLDNSLSISITPYYDCTSN